MSEPVDIFLSHSGAQKEFVEQLFTELTRQYGQYSVFFDKDSIKHGDSISSSIVEYAKTCKLVVAVLSDDYFFKSKPPMLELAAGYTASKNGNGVPCLLPVFFELRPEHAKSFKNQLKWNSKWDEWRRNEIMSTRIPYESRPNKVEPQIWRDAFSKLLDTRGPVYVPHENENKSEVFVRKAARDIVGKLDELSKTNVPYEVTYRSDSLDMEYLNEETQRPWLEEIHIPSSEETQRPWLQEIHIPSSEEIHNPLSEETHNPLSEEMVEYLQSLISHQLFELRERASTSGETHLEFERTGLEMSEREEIVAERERKVTEREISITEREISITEREISINKRQRHVEVRETNVGELKRKVKARERRVKAREASVDERERNVSDPLARYRDLNGDSLLASPCDATLVGTGLPPRDANTPDGTGSAPLSAIPVDVFAGFFCDRL